MTDRGDVAEILDDYLKALEAGNPPDREALLAAHEDLAEELQAALLGIDIVHSAAPRLAPEEDGDARPGRSLGDYRLLRELGRGGMAVVYEAEQVSLGRRVALKVLPFAAVLDPKQLQRFKNEAMAAAHLRHPNIVPVYGVGCDRGVHYYAMQFVEGQSLATAIRDLKGGGSGEGPRTPISSHGSNREPAYIRMAAALGVQAAEALDHAHQLGIVHRDVKPGNLLVDQAGTLWVTDFGLASSVADVGLTATGELLGTIRYMSPEQALAKRVPVDHRTDVYSLGVTLYEFFTLEPAFPGDDPHLVIQDIAFKEPVLPRRLNPTLPRDLETVILKAMSKDPGCRYATAQEMADDLGRFLENRPIEAKRPGLLRRAAKWSRRHRTLVGATLALLLLSTAGLATGTVLLWREQAQTKAAFESAQANLDLALQALDQIYMDEAEGHPRIREGLPKDLLQKGLGFYEAFVKENARNKGLVRVMGRACQRAGLIFRELGEEERAVKSLERSISAYDRALEVDPRDTAVHNNRGIALDDLGRFEEALAAYDRALAIDPRDASLHANRGAVLCDHLGRPGEALAEFDRAIDLDPRDAMAHHNRGKALRDLGRFEDALAACDRAIGLDPRSAFALRAAVLQSLGRFEEALAACERALGIKPRDARAHYNRAGVLRDLKRFEEALGAYDRALDIDPRDADAHSGRGSALRDLGRFEEALAAYGRALEIDPRKAVAHNNRAAVLKGLGRFEEALAAYDRALEIDSRDVAAHNNRGIVLHYLGRFEEELAAYDRALEIDPRVAPIRVNRGVVLCDHLGRPGDALAEFDRAIALDPGGLDAHTNRGVALSKLGRFEEALAAYERAAEIDPRDARAHYRRGDALRGLERFAEALAACDKALLLDPRYAAAHTVRATALNNLGRFEEALKACDRALKIDPGYALAHHSRGNALYMLGRFEEAVVAYDRALEIDPQDAQAHDNRGAALAAKGQVEAAERKAELEGRLDGVLSGKARPRDALERTEFALVLYDKARHAESARMYAEAFADDAALAEDLAEGHRYNAACSAALAAAPGGADAAEGRGRALEWLRADLTAREKAATDLVATLEHWKKDPDFASVRDRLGDLPEPEREAWRGLWAAVDLALGATRPAAK